MKKPIRIVTIILLLISLMPSRVFAETSTYFVLTEETFIASMKKDSYDNEYSYYLTTSGDVRYVAIRNGAEVRIVPVSLSNTSKVNIKRINAKNNNEVNTNINVNSTYSYNGITYYCASGLALTEADINVFNSDIPIVNRDYSIGNWWDNAYYYAYGDGAVAPEDPISFGDLKNLGFYTKFVNSQQSNISQMALNKDVITWDPFQDTNGNDLNNADYRVDIQAATIDYEASTKSDLLNQVLNDMTTGSWSELVSITPNVGQYEITWDQVAQQLWHTDNITIEFWNNLFNVYDSARGVFFKNGWIYRIRLRTSDNSYVGQWQTVYNITSMPPADSDKVYTNYYVYNYTVPNEDTYEIIQNINNINNTENNWYQNDQPFNPETAGDNWLSKLIEAILSFLGQLIHDILGLFTFDSFEIPDFESNKINIINNTGMFGESLQFTEQLKQAIEDVEYVEPVLTYPGLTIDNVQLIQPMTFNLNDFVQNEEIQDIRSLAYLVTDGLIYLSLILLIKNKIMGVLKK